ncbi:hypothetical protein GCM10020001_119260 [Nonomuraea salmonea]
MPPRGDTSWHQPFLDLVAGGATFADAARELDINNRTLYYHLDRHPKLRQDAQAARQQGGLPPGRRSAVEDTSWHQPFLDLVAGGATFIDAAHELKSQRQAALQPLRSASEVPAGRPGRAPAEREPGTRPAPARRLAGGIPEPHPVRRDDHGRPESLPRLLHHILVGVPRRERRGFPRPAA